VPTGLAAVAICAFASVVIASAAKQSM